MILYISLVFVRLSREDLGLMAEIRLEEEKLVEWSRRGVTLTFLSWRDQTEFLLYSKAIE